ncbi:MAG TPA: glycosyltransferase family 39 protein [Edaphobacter sp.]|nr:glycosyltransferase family 39 protein [Edaphobacter sp.]
MPQALVSSTEHAKRRVSWTLAQLEKFALAFEARGNVLVFALFVPIYLTITTLVARHKLIWDDEFFTLYLSRPATMGQMLDGLKTGADQHPPLFYYLIHQVTALFGLSHVTLRLLPMAGFGLMCVCLFYLLRNRTSVLWAFLGMLMPLTSSAIYYATEARGYGSMLGFCALALLAWQRLASSHRRRWLWLGTLFCASALAVSSHYYAVLFFFALGLGEIARTVQLRRLDLPVWLALAGAGVPLLAFLSVIRSANSYSAHFWAVPIWGSLLEFYPGILGALANILILGAIPFLIAALRSESFEQGGRERILRHFSTYEVIAWASITAVPLFAMLLAKFVTHGFTERYALAGIIGAIVALCHFGFAVAPRPRSFPLLLCCGALLYFVVHGLRTIRIQELSITRLSEQMHLLGNHADSPLALSDITIFHQVSFYSPRTMVQNIAYVASPEASVKYLQQDTVDRGLLDLRPWFPLQIVPSQTFLAEHREFLVYAYIGAWSWLTYDLTPPDYDTRMLERYNSDVLLRAKRLVDTPPDSAPPSATDHPTDELFRRISSDGPSICKQWMPHDSFCDDIERKREQSLLHPLVPRQSVR